MIDFDQGEVDYGGITSEGVHQRKTLWKVSETVHKSDCILLLKAYFPSICVWCFANIGQLISKIKIDRAKHSDILRCKFISSSSIDILVTVSYF